jgi:hypothetical protein
MIAEFCTWIFLGLRVKMGSHLSFKELRAQGTGLSGGLYMAIKYKLNF